MTKTKNNRKIVILAVVFAVLLINIYIAFQNVTVYAEAPGFDKRAACNKVGCPDTNLRLCAEIHATVGGFGVVYKCYEPEFVVE